MRIAIDTIVDYSNYGNRLQNYALQKVLENQGHEVITLKNYTHIVNKEPRVKRIKRLLAEGGLLKKGYKKIIRKASKAKQSKRLNSLREENFKKFTEKYIHESDFVLNQNTKVFDFDRDIDCYVVGSDQVWNYNFTRFSSFDFISFSKKPKISYAASFGVDSVPDNLLNIYRKGLNSFNYISVREKVGKNLVEEISGQKATIVLDPTLLLDKSEWMKLITNKKLYSKKFILVYFLGKPNKFERQYITDFAKIEGYEVKTLMTYSDVNLWKADPSEFINLFSQAEAVFTDSFHACVFSIIFEKYFEVFNRNYTGPSMNSRLDTLFDDLNLGSRWYDGKIKETVIDYVSVKKKLDKRKRESIEFLNDSLNGLEF
ncbi:polysaccharide pyruvyl transferase family protein [Companilactobacillus suantsaicola]|uniref:Polysaccharide pyruvyl transferase family protein n=1 Tax=Companilactobacillus suantsaicola TaxID=2487723 RepID=A0A4Z0JLP0_9LACO|nr:polysaccharide pyruvyl transferase family protein [Companilactobacillus suantsaicola]TGD22753.1 polysaccharide pyruvyl transferase family protein [Companilactobacillus suantsaicola]